MKNCWRCGISRPKEDFMKDSSRADGLSHVCKVCDRERFKGYYLKHRDHVNERVKKYTQTPTGKEVARRRNKHMMEKYPEKYKTRYMTRMYIKAGKITKKPCEICGDANVEVHHPDYSDAINVHFYCRYHHRVVEGRSVV